MKLTYTITKNLANEINEDTGYLLYFDNKDKAIKDANEFIYIMAKNRINWTLKDLTK
jgi:hypothetical protein